MNHYKVTDVKRWISDNRMPIRYYEKLAGVIGCLYPM